MALSNDLISQFVRITNDKPTAKRETIVYGTIVEKDNTKYVKIDGSDLLTPISTTTVAEDGERVTVMIKGHTAIVNGNLSSPSARNGSVEEIGNKITEVEILIADKVSTKVFDAQVGRIDTLVSDNVRIKERLTATEADIDTLEADNVTINQTLTAHEASIDTLETTKLSATDADIKYATIESLEVTNATVRNLNADYGEFKNLATDKFTAVEADIDTLETTKLSATDADIKYATIDFSNIGKAAIEKFYATSGIIKDLVIGDSTITGELVGVTIKGNLIEGGTIIADKLVIKGSDGLYYKLNTNGVTTEAEQTEYNSLNGDVILANSITATKINVDDLVAFDATIGGFKITDSSIYSGVKETADNTTRGIYLDKDGQFVVGDSNNFLKFYRDTNNVYKLAISAGSIILSASGKTVETAIDDAKNEAISKVDALQIGGRNYFSSKKQTAFDENNELIMPSYQNTGSFSQLYNLTKPMSYFVGKECILSFDCISPNGSTPISIYNQNGNPRYSISNTTGIITPIGDTWTHQEVKLTVIDRGDSIDYSENTSNKIEIYCSAQTGCKLRNVKLEIGNKATDWTPAPEDVNTAIANTITGVDVEYALSTSNTTAPTTGWATTAPTWESGKHMWQRTVTTYGDGTTSISAETCISGAKGDKGDKGETGPQGEQGIQGIQGPQGDQGVPGSNGTDGKTSYFHIAYANSADGSVDFSVSNSTGRNYIGTYVDFVSTDSTDRTKYTWQLVKGSQGDKGDQGIAGSNGADGKTSYLHIAYATNDTGTSGFSVSDSTNKTYIGQYTDFVQADSTDPTKYSWTLIKGAKGDTGPTGKGISSITNYYLATPSSGDITTDTDGWTETIQNVSASKKYLWNYEKVTYTDNSTYNTTPCIIGAFGDKGENGAPGSTGVGISGVAEKYAVSNSSATAPTTWYDTVQTMTSDNRYLWNYEIITYTNNTTSETNKRVIGVYGDQGPQGGDGATGPQGETGIGVSEIVEQYYLSVSDDSQVGGEWLLTQPEWASDTYIWTRSKITWSDESITYTEPVLADAINKANTAAEDASNSAKDAKSTADNAQTRITAAEASITMINNTISSLVRDENGASLMTQTENGWTFNMGSFTDTLDSATSELDVLKNESDEMKNDISTLQSSVDDLGALSSYVVITTYNNQPCLELGKVGNAFKTRITNTSIQFMDGTAIPAYISNQKLYIEKAEVTDELQFGDFAWKKRPNGNVGLMWKGGTV